ncbi:MAG: hypothetical protein IJ493_10625 [Clostridia bacterium]|nr:hypothetical protein [Clostridia bacterium]
MKRTISLTMAILLAASFSSCGQTEPSTDSGDTTTAPAVTTNPEPYSGINLDGYTMRVLNWEGKLWNTQSVLDYEEQTGDSVSDAIYARNRTVEEKLNMTLEVVYPPSGNCQTDFLKTMNAGEDTYDAIFNKSSEISANMASGYLYNLYELDAIDLDQPWWYTTFNQNMILEGDKLYQIATPAHLMSFDMTVACYFNKEIIEHYNLDMPYDTVREGKWTYDAMLSYMKQCINLNGDEAFSETGSSTYGVATFSGWLGILTGNADGLVKLEADGTPYFAGASEKFYNVIDKMTEVFVGDGHHCGNADTYDDLFAEGHSLFSIISIGNASVFREMDYEYGILPAPKYSESEEYKSPMGISLLLGIPSTSTTAEKTAIAFDALSYYSYNDVMPAYYNSLCYKGLRDEDSIDMLEIISDSRWADIGCVYGWTYDLLSNLSSKLLSGNLNTASLIETNKNTVESKINSAMNY